MAFKTHKDIYQALIEWKKIKKSSSGHYILMIDDKVKWEDGTPRFEDFSDYREWSIYKEPKPKKKVTLYRYTYREDNGPDIEQTNWISYGFKEGWSNHFTLLKNESKEVEYDDV